MAMQTRRRGRPIPLIGNEAAPAVNNATRYFSLVGVSSQSAATDALRQMIGRRGFLRNFRVTILTAPTGVGKSYAYNIRRNAGATLLTVTFTDLEVGLKSDETNESAVDVGDYFVVSSTPAALPTQTQAFWSVDFFPS